MYVAGYNWQTVRTFTFLRMILLMMVAVCLNACIALEQPYSSFFEFYPRFRELVEKLQNHGGPSAVP